MNTLIATESKGSKFIKLLRVYVSNDLKWTHHVDYLIETLATIATLETLETPATLKTLEPLSMKTL